MRLGHPILAQKRFNVVKFAPGENHPRNFSPWYLLKDPRDSIIKIYVLRFYVFFVVSPQVKGQGLAFGGNVPGSIIFFLEVFRASFGFSDHLVIRFRCQDCSSLALQRCLAEEVIFVNRHCFPPLISSQTPNSTMQPLQRILQRSICAHGPGLS